MRLLGHVQIRCQKKTDRGSKQINKLKQELVCIPQPSNKPQRIFSAETQRQRLTPGPNPAVSCHFKTLPKKTYRGPFPPLPPGCRGTEDALVALIIICRSEALLAAFGLHRAKVNHCNPVLRTVERDFAERHRGGDARAAVAP